LAIVQSVVADHAGTIAVESRPGGGAVFIITLPKASEAKS
jgi:signal transduction histidine kinase